MNEEVGDNLQTRLKRLFEAETSDFRGLIQVAMQVEGRDLTKIAKRYAKQIGGTKSRDYRLNTFLETMESRYRQIAEDAKLASETEKPVLESQLHELGKMLADPIATFEEHEARMTTLGTLLDNAETPDEQEAKAALEAGDFDSAEKIFDRIKADGDLAVRKTADAAFARGQIAEEQMRWAEAAEHYAKAARLNPNFDTLYSAREFAWRSGDYTTAISLGADLIKAAIEQSGEGSHEHATALNEHGLTLNATGRHEEAEPLYREALDITRDSLGPKHPETGTSLNNLAALLETTGRYEEAEPLYREALQITRDSLGPKHPETGTHLNNLAGLLRYTGRCEQAEPLYREALDITRDSLGPKHPETGTSLNNLAALLNATGRYVEAEPLYCEALDIFEAALGPDHPDTKTVKENYEIFLAKRPK